jgi:hypothetical protein
MCLVFEALQVSRILSRHFCHPLSVIIPAALHTFIHVPSILCNSGTSTQSLNVLQKPILHYECTCIYVALHRHRTAQTLYCTYIILHIHTVHIQKCTYVILHRLRTAQTLNCTDTEIHRYYTEQTVSCTDIVLHGHYTVQTQNCTDIILHRHRTAQTLYWIDTEIHSLYTAQTSKCTGIMLHRHRNRSVPNDVYFVICFEQDWSVRTKLRTHSIN